MQASELKALFKGHAFFEGMPDAHIEALSGCAKQKIYRAGREIFGAREPAHKFYVLNSGRVAIDIVRQDREPVSIQTLGPGDVLGWSWLFPPHEWLFNARVIEDVDALVLDAHCLRGKCDADPALGYDLMTRFSAIVVSRLRATQMQLLDMYQE